MNIRFTIGVAIVSAIAGGALVQNLQAQVKPKAYVIAETEVKDPTVFKNYAEGTAMAVPQAGGRFSVNGGRTFVINGAAPKRLALIEWESFEQAQAFYQSDAYKKFVADRDNGSNFRAILVEGLPANK